MLLLLTLSTHLVLANNVETKNTIISYSVEHASQKEVHVAGVLRVLDKR